MRFVAGREPASVTISRRNLADGTARAVVVVSKNANVANGPDGHADAEALVDGVAERLGCPAGQVLVASTGVIGRRYPMDRVLAGVARLPRQPAGRDLRRAARGIMTTDTVEKVATVTIGAGPAHVAGFAKGGAVVGLVPKDGGTLLTYNVEAQIGGKLAQIGQRLVNGAAKKMADDFFAKFSAMAAASAV